ncbi:MAG TPA: AMP-dependent synthetase, partial [Nocardioides sp.]|nr:AMP-dependent synthetase [Nocardioides sp.]
MTTEQVAGTAAERPALGLSLLGGHDDAVAIVSAGRELTYAELARLVDQRGRELGDPDRLLVLEMSNDLPSVVTYLAALAIGRPVVVVGPGRHEDVVERYRPALLATPGGDRTLRPRGPAPVLHPELAVLLSTSGSTGSPKLVRLSRDNVLANARSIAAYL